MVGDGWWVRVEGGGWRVMGDGWMVEGQQTAIVVIKFKPIIQTI